MSPCDLTPQVPYGIVRAPPRQQSCSSRQHRKLDSESQDPGKEGEDGCIIGFHFDPRLWTWPDETLFVTAAWRAQGYPGALLGPTDERSSSRPRGRRSTHVIRCDWYPFCITLWLTRSCEGSWMSREKKIIRGTKHWIFWKIHFQTSKLTEIYFFTNWKL